MSHNRTLLDYKILTPRVAALLAKNMSTKEVAMELNVSETSVKKVRGMDECKAIVKAIGEAHIIEAKTLGRVGLADRVPEALRVLDVKLKANDLEAVKIVFKGVGVVDNEPAAAAGSQTLTVVMPGAQIEKPAIDVTSETEE